MTRHCQSYRDVCLFPMSNCFVVFTFYLFRVHTIFSFWEAFVKFLIFFVNHDILMLSECCCPVEQLARAVQRIEDGSGA